MPQANFVVSTVEQSEYKQLLAETTLWSTLFLTMTPVFLGEFLHVLYQRKRGKNILQRGYLK